MDRQKFRIVGLQESFNTPKVAEALQLVPTDRMLTFKQFCSRVMGIRNR